MIPSDIIDLAQWLKASSLSLPDGDPVTTWADSSGNGRSAAAQTGTVIYRSSLGGGPALQFDAASALSFASFMGAWTEGELFVVLECGADPNVVESQTAFPIGNVGGSAFSDHYPWTDGHIYNGWGSSVRKDCGDPTRPLTSWHLVNISSKAGEWTLRINNQVIFTTATNTVSFSGGTIYIGKDTRLPCFYLGYLKDIFSFPRVLDSTERDGMWAYAQSAYGVVDPLISGNFCCYRIESGGAWVDSTAPAGGSGAITTTIQRKPDGGSYADVATALRFHNTGLTNGQKYVCRCKYEDGVGQILYSDEIEFIPNDPPTPMMESADIARLQALYLAGDVFAVGVKTQYDDLWSTYGADAWFNSLIPAAAWFATGDTFYRDHAIDCLLLIPQSPANLNDTREFAWQNVIVYRWMQPYMTDDQQAAVAFVLSEWCWDLLDYRVQGHGTRQGDNDVTFGHYSGLMCSDICRGTDFLNHVQNPAGNYPGFNPTPDWRDWITTGIAFADHGEWYESSMYNPSTLQLVLLMARIGGQSRFPEIFAWLPKLRDTLIWQMIPSLTDSTVWGDVEYGSDPPPFTDNRLSLMTMVIGLGGDVDGQLLQLFSQMVQTYTIGFVASPPRQISRMVLFFDQAQIDNTPNVVWPTGFRVNQNLGNALYRQSDQIVQATYQQVTIEDHSPKNFRDVLVWMFNGSIWERVVGHVIEYQGSSLYFNTGLTYDFYSMYVPNRRTMTLAEETADGFLTRGGYGPSTYEYGITPPEPVFTYSSSMRWHKTGARAGALVVNDTFAYDQDPLPTLDNGWGQQDIDDALTQPGASQQLWYAPTEPTITVNGYSWTTTGGQTVELVTDAPHKTYEFDAFESGPSKMNTPIWRIHFWKDGLSAAITTQVLINGATVPDSPTAGTLTEVSATSSLASLSLATNTAGTGPYTNQLQRSLHGAGSWSDIGSPVSGTTASLTDTTVTAGGDYDYRVLVTDSADATDFSNVLEVQVASAVRYLPPAYLLLLMPRQEIGLAFGIVTPTFQAGPFFLAAQSSFCPGFVETDSFAPGLIAGEGKGPAV